MVNRLKKVAIFFLILFSIFYTLSFSSAVISILAPSTGANESYLSSVLFMVEFVNNTDILFFGTGQNQINASFFAINGSQRTFVANSSTCSFSSGQTYACWTSFNLTGFQDGFYNITASVFNSTTSRNASINATHFYLDSVKPLIFSENFSSLSTGGNYSQSIIINLSAIDATTGISAVIFNITNSSGQQNATITAAREGSSNNFVATINASHFVEGFINITAIVNDTAKNTNDSAKIYRLIFDNTPPTVSFTCDDYTVDEDDVMDCTCSGTDSLTGINSTSYDASPSTSNTGNNQQSTCIVMDKAGNINRSTISYNVTGSSGGSSGSGSSSGSSGGTTTGSSNSGNSTNANNTTQNSSSGEANQLEANQENQNETNFKINYWILTIVLAGIALIVTAFILFKKGILQRLLKFNK